MLLRLFGIFLCSMLLGSELYATTAVGGVQTCDPVTDTDCTAITEDIFLTTPHSTIPADGGLFTTPGLQIGGFLGQTPYSGNNLNYAVRAYTRQGYGQHFFGEASISLGVVSGPTYKSRLLPVEYRLNYQLAGLGMSDFELFNRTGSPYVYIGGGFLYHMPVALPAPDDPLTEDMGDRLPASPFWDFDGGISAVVPAGVGVDIRLDPSTVFNVQFGYSQSIAITDNSFRSGYWGISIGLNFARTNTGVRTQARSIKTFTRSAAPVAKIDQPKPPVVFLNDIENRFIQFDALSAGIKPEYQTFVEYIAFVMELNKDINLQILGHANQTGTDRINEMISYSRALNVYNELIDRGIGSIRLGYASFSDRRPILEDDSTADINRRVEFRTSKAKTKPRDEIYQPNYLSEFELNTPLIPLQKLIFIRNSLTPDDYSEKQILLISHLLHSQPDMKLIVLSQSGAGAGPKLREALAYARPNVIRAKLIELGIDPQRILAANKAENARLFEEYDTLLGGEQQMNLLIPVEEF